MIEKDDELYNLRNDTDDVLYTFLQISSILRFHILCTMY